MFCKQNCSHFQHPSVWVHSANSWNRCKNEPELSKFGFTGCKSSSCSPNLFIKFTSREKPTMADVGKGEVGLYSGVESESNYSFFCTRTLSTRPLLAGFPRMEVTCCLMAQVRLWFCIACILCHTCNNFWLEGGSGFIHQWSVFACCKNKCRSIQQILFKFLLHAQHCAVYLGNTGKTNSWSFLLRTL